MIIAGGAYFLLFGSIITLAVELIWFPFQAALAGFVAGIGFLLGMVGIIKDKRKSKAMFGTLFSIFGGLLVIFCFAMVLSLGWQL